MLRRASIYDQNITRNTKLEKGKSSRSNTLQEQTPSTGAGPKVRRGSAPAETPSWGKHDSGDSGL